MAGKSILFQENTRTINHETGEVISEKQNKLVRKNTPDFIMLFTQTSQQLKEANLTAGQNKMLFYLLTGGYILKNNRLDLTPGARDELSSETGLSRGTVNKNIAALINKKIILVDNGKRSGHSLNPFIFGKGKFTDLEKLRYEVALEYNFDEMSLQRDERTRSYYKSVKALSSERHEITSVEHRSEGGAEETTIEVQKKKDNDTDTEAIETESFPVASEVANDADNYELSLQKEKNREIELRNEEKKLEIEAMQLKIEMKKLGLEE